MPSEARDALTVYISHRPFVVARSPSAKHLLGEDVLLHMRYYIVPCECTQA